MVGQAVSEDTGLSEGEAHLLSVGLVGMAQVTARYWLGSRDHIPREAAEQLVARLAWRGISGWPRSESAEHPGPTPRPASTKHADTPARSTKH